VRQSVATICCAVLACSGAVSVGQVVGDEVGPAGLVGMDALADDTTVEPSDLLWDNGGTNGANGVSHLGSPRRSVLEDFVVPEGVGWEIAAFFTRHVWQTLEQPSATGYQLAIWSDVAGEPGELTRSLAVNDLSESLSGRSWFGRPEMDIWVSFVPVHLKPGVYWLDMHVVGPENCLQLVHDRGDRLSPCWVNYSDIGGLRPGREVFFADYDVDFALIGQQGSCGFADCNGDSVIDSRDFVCYLNLWAARDPAAECNGDLEIDTQDFICFLTLWNQGC
jgi:hypothetical protein